MTSRSGALATKNLSAEAKSIMDYMKTEFAKFKTEVSEDINNLRSDFTDLRELLAPKLIEVDDLKIYFTCFESIATYIHHAQNKVCYHLYLIFTVM